MSRTFITSDGVSADALQKNPNFLLDNYILEGKTIPIHLFGDNIATAIDDAITYLTNAGGGRVHIPANGTNFELEIRVFKDRNGTYHTNFEYNYDRYPTVESRPYTNENWQIGDTIFNSQPNIDKCVGWVCTAAGTPGTWTPFGWTKKFFSEIEIVDSLPDPNEFQLGRQLLAKDDDGKMRLHTCIFTDTYEWSNQIVDRLQVSPEFAQTIEECTDTTKLYVLPDGFIYAYMYTEKTTGLYTNLADPTSEDWKDGYRISSSGISAQSGKTVCNTITVKIGDIIRVKGVSFVANQDRYTLSGTRVSDGLEVSNYQYVSELPDTYMGYNLTDDEVHEFTVLPTVANSGLTSETLEFRCAFTTPTDASTIIITKNEEIKEPTTTREFEWSNTGHAFNTSDADWEAVIDDLMSDNESLKTKALAMDSEIKAIDKRVQTIESNGTSIPTFWESALETAKDKIIAKQELSGANCVNFVWTTDVHANLAAHEKGVRLGIVAKAIMDETNIPLFVSTGDLMSPSSYASTSNIYTELALVQKWFSPIPYYQQALVMGNHDGAWGDATSGLYYKQLPLDIMYNLIYRKQAMDLRRVSGDNGTYYYIDNIPQKMRFIMLNSNNTPSYEENEDGTAKYNRFHLSCYCQVQLDWLINVALDMPDGYSACIFAHEPYPGDWSQMVGIVDAYNRKGSYANTFTDTENTWRNSTINVNFSDVKGEIVAVFAGHVHYDYMRYVGHNPMYSTCPLITMTNSIGDFSRQSPDGGIIPTRTNETDTEFAIDIVTIDKANRKIYMTRLGVGSDREISY